MGVPWQFSHKMDGSSSLIKLFSLDFCYLPLLSILVAVKNFNSAFLFTWVLQKSG